MGLSPYAVGCKYVSPGAVPALGSLLRDPPGWERATYHTECWLSACGTARAVWRVWPGRIWGLQRSGSHGWAAGGWAETRVNGWGGC